MNFSTFLLFAALGLGQSAPLPATGEDPNASSVSEQQLVRLANPRRRSAARELLAEMLRPRDEAVPQGRLVSLGEALRAGTSLPAKQQIVSTYWSLVIAEAKLLTALDSSTGLGNLAADGDEQTAALVRHVQADAEAQEHSLRVDFLAAQYALAQRLGWSGDVLPIAADRPHVGAYLSRLETLFPGTAPPLPARKIAAVLPLRATAMDRLAESCLAARDALNEASSEVAGGQTGEQETLDLMQRTQGCESAFLEAVARYNGEIAAYVFLPEIAQRTLAGAYGESQETTIVNMLIPPAEEPTRSAATPENGDSLEDRTELATAGPPFIGDPQTAALKRTILRRADYGASDISAGRYQHMVQRKAVEGAQLLAVELFGSANAYVADGVLSGSPRPLTLEDCVRSQDPLGKLTAIREYWILAARQAKAQVFQNQLARLKELEFVARQFGPPEENSIMLLVASDVQRAAAELAEAEAEAVEDQFVAIPRLLGEPPQAWQFMATNPHAGEYNMKFDRQPPEIASQPEIQLLHQSLPLLHQAILSRTRAVLESEAARLASVDAFTRGDNSIQALLAATKAQTSEELRLINDTVRYNRAIAEYALSVSPSNLSLERLLGALILR